MALNKKEYDKEKRKQYYENNKETTKEYYQKNKEWIKEDHKEYNKTERAIKLRTIYFWKRKGVVHHDFDELYEYYLNTKNCELCECELTRGRYCTKTTRCLRHDKTTGLFSIVVCGSCSAKIK